MQTLRTSCFKRSRLLSGVGAALATLLAATTAQAQTASAASGIRVVDNLQAARAGTIRADVNEPATASVIAGPVADSDIDIADNRLSTSARGNDAALTLVADPIGDDGYGPTSLNAGADTIGANGATVIANRQATGTSQVITDIFPTELSIAADTATASTLTLSRNSADAAVLGNSLAAAITLTGTGSDSGAGIVSLQSMGTGGIAARSLVATRLSANTAAGSTLDNSGNLDRATAVGNSADNRISTAIGALEVPASNRLAASVPMAGPTDPEVFAGVALLNRQAATGGTVKARAGTDGSGPAFATMVAGDIDSASVISGGNGLDAFATANRSTNDVELGATRVTGAPSPSSTAPGAVTILGNVQRADVGPILGSTAGGTAIEVQGNVTSASISASATRLRAAATANLTDNRLLVDAGAIDAIGGNPTSTGEAIAVVEPDSGARMGAAIGIQIVQDFGRSALSANQTSGITQITVRGAATGSTLRADDNLATAGATGNSDANLLALSAATVRSNAAVNSVQTGNGTVDASLGDASTRAGASLLIEEGSTDSRLFVTENRLTATAIGSTGANRLTVSAATVEGAGSGNAQAGPDGIGYGGSATFVLASNQKLGEPSGIAVPVPHIASTVFGTFGAEVQGMLSQSSVAIRGNAQRANAIGNTGLNQADVSASVLADSATTALSAFQYGQATIAAISDAALASPAMLDSSTVSIDGNSSIALGLVNDTENSLSISGAHTGASSALALLDVEPLGPPTAGGDHVLANQQFAAGEVGATAALSIKSPVAASALNGSHLTVSGNIASAEASANRADNAVSIAAASGDVPGAGLINTQNNSAQVSSAAQADWHSDTPFAAGTTALGSTVVIDGNSISALARGNAANNAISLAAGEAGGARSATAIADRFGASVEAPLALLNGQSNYAAVAAIAVDTGAPLNGPGAASRSAIAMHGNSMAASAYGNSASNSASVGGPGGTPSVAIVNAQVNYGTVTAVVTGAGLAGTPSLNGSGLSINGNQLVASAVGNQVSGTITTPR